MTFYDYLIALVAYTLAKVSGDIEENRLMLQSEARDNMIAADLAFEKRLIELHLLLQESPTAGYDSIRENDDILEELWRQARANFCTSRQALEIKRCDGEIVNKGYTTLGVVVAEELVH